MSRLAIPFGLLAVLACGDATRPERPAPYQFAIDCSNPAVGCTDDAPPLLTFKWPRHALPVRIWVQPGSDLSRKVAEGVRGWIDAGLYGELRAGFVSDSQRADILFLRSEPVAFVRQDEATLDCQGRTPILVNADTTMILPFRTTISPRLGARIEEVERCMRIVVAHELGHSLGLFLHSDDPTDLMHGRPRAEALSLRDRATFSTLYHSEPTVGIPAGR